jgi:methylenetetrahydrofolate reductase (NADPH)
MSSTTFSVEFFPPKDGAGEERLWSAVEHLKEMAPDFISVTYGAGGSTRDRTVRITKELTERTGIPTVAHLTCVGSTEAELNQILDQYSESGIRSILALRGDPTGGPSAPWEMTPGGFDHAFQLVELAAARGSFSIGVAAFPDGHPASGGNFEQDIDVLIAKEQAGATFATTQFFFEVEKWERLVHRLRARGCSLPVIAGVLPITNVKQLKRMGELSGASVPDFIVEKFHGFEEDPTAVAEIGVAIATEFCQRLLASGVPGLHFYTMNTSHATMDIAASLGLNLRGAR